MRSIRDILGKLRGRGSGGAATARQAALGMLLLAGACWWLVPAMAPEPEPQEVGDLAPADLRSVIVRTKVVCKFWAFDRAPVGYDGGGRSLFEYAAIPSLPTPEPAAAEVIRKTELDEPSNDERAEPPVRQVVRDQPPREPGPPAIPLTFIGLVGEAVNPIAVFLDGNDFVLAHEGDVVKAGFQVQKISYDTLQIGFTDPRFADENRILPMGG